MNKSLESVFDQVKIKALVKKDIDVFVFDELDSTNQWLIDQLSSDIRKPLLCVAETQRKGRGRSGRVWQSPAQSNIYMSFSRLLDCQQKNISAISLVIGLAIVRVFKKLGVAGVTLKWPNDVLLRGRKLAGVLIEAKKTNKQIYLVIGVGINVQMPKDFDVSSKLGWCDLSVEGLDLQDRSRIIAMVYEECEILIESFLSSGFTPFKNEWMAVDEYAGKEVVIMDQDKVVVSGVESGVDEAGCLLLQTDGGLERIFSGDVSLRVKE